MLDFALALETAQKVGVADFDFLFMGDGSGGVIGDASGWFVYTFSRDGVAREFGGHCSSGTTNQAELSPFLHALWAIDSEFFGSRPPHPVRVEILSDSEVTVRCGNGQYARKANGALWAQLDWFVGRGYSLHFTHVPRNSTPFHEEADHLSKKYRRLLAAPVL